MKSGSDAHTVWDRIWAVAEDFVEHAELVLGAQLRETHFLARRIDAGPSCAAGEIVAGRARFRLDCLLECHSPRGGESDLAEVFGADAPLARIVVQRELDGGRRVRLCELVADPLAGLWLSIPSEWGLASLADTAAVERFLWSFLADAGV